MIRSKYRQRYRMIPYGLGPNGEIVTPQEAQPGKSHHCPECKKRLVLRTSKLKNPFFAHLRKDKKCKLTKSPVVLAKHVLLVTLREWMKGAGDPVQLQPFCNERTELPRNEIHQIKVNHRIRINQRSLVSHLSLLDRYGLPILHIEIRDRPRPQHIKHPSWLEVSAEEILSNPYLLSPLNPDTDFLPPTPVQLSLF
ncbi:competence protein CoiA-like protein [Laceyella sacchari]|uniref:competence protein CoiA family protein n=1 Tax=Laceyella sacchari TaxID=37482 RepID=UPI00104B1542|nr:competence protein CoiA family protein [Laceyella sacchari]TCW41604.1 competence protein CoiA-like protein [Laceyella sacchari]